MKKTHVRILFGMIALLASTVFSEPSGGSWHPANNLGPGEITFVRYDITQSYGQIRAELKNKQGTLNTYNYDFDPSSLTSMNRANAIYAALLAAQSSGKGVLLYVMNSNTQINAIQVGD